ncbi:MAG: exodeoxyribonuclease VII large subunit [Rhodospirillaceae bacterium]|nr:exodeoxyribonuclease VII large subunit [Rhodospirillaceae bacterium]
MPKSPDTDAIEHNLPILGVGEISQALKGVVEQSFARVRVRGEISGFKRAASGHMYFTLKDENAVLDGVCWKGTAGRLGLRPEDGIDIVATGRLTTYPGRSKYQIVVDQMELAGEGALLKLLEDRKKKLAAEGLFEESQKRPLPFIPEVIGVVTSPTGAVIRDILHRIGDRFPRRVILWPVVVQGDTAAEQIASAIEGFNALAAGGSVPRPDVLIVARGGGSLEDLWAFNEEVVVRAAAASDIPLISAVGHETDVTLIDFASDRRAPTPTAAAEIAVPVRLNLLAQLMDDGSRLVGGMNRLLGDRRVRLEGLVRGLPNLKHMVDEAAQRLDDWAERLANGLSVGLKHRKLQLRELAAGLISPERRIAAEHQRLNGETRALGRAVRGLLKDRGMKLNSSRALLESFSYERVLERGFALVRDSAGENVRSAGAVTSGADMTIRFHDGDIAVRASGAKPTGKPKKRTGGDPDDDQGTLL